MQTDEADLKHLRPFRASYSAKLTWLARPRRAEGSLTENVVDTGSSSTSTHTVLATVKLCRGADNERGETPIKMIAKRNGGVV